MIWCCLYRLIVEFSSLKAFVKFVLHIQVGLPSYPNCVSLTALPKIGHLRFVLYVDNLSYFIAKPKLNEFVVIYFQFESTVLQNLLQECSVLWKISSLSLRCLLDEVFAPFASVFRAFVCKRASCLSRPCSIIFILPVHARYVFSCALQRIPLLPCHWLHVNCFVNWDMFSLAYLRHTKFNVTPCHIG